MTLAATRCVAAYLTGDSTPPPMRCRACRRRRRPGHRRPRGIRYSPPVLTQLFALATCPTIRPRWWADGGGPAAADVAATRPHRYRPACTTPAEYPHAVLVRAGASCRWLSLRRWILSRSCSASSAHDHALAATTTPHEVVGGLLPKLVARWATMGRRYLARTCTCWTTRCSSQRKNSRRSRRALPGAPSYRGSEDGRRGPSVRP